MKKVSYIHPKFYSIIYATYLERKKSFPLFMETIFQVLSEKYQEKEKKSTLEKDLNLEKKKFILKGILHSLIVASEKMVSEKKASEKKDKKLDLEEKKNILSLRKTIFQILDLDLQEEEEEKIYKIEEKRVYTLIKTIASGLLEASEKKILTIEEKNTLMNTIFKALSEEQVHIDRDNEQVQKNDEVQKKWIPLFFRNTTLIPLSIGNTFIVYNGKKYLKVLVSEEIVGQKLGEFSRTRSRYFFKSAKNKKKGKKK